MFKNLNYSKKFFKLNCREQSQPVPINSRRPHTVRLGAGFLLIAVQIGCSVFAGVYNEHLIKNVAGGDVHIMVQGRIRDFAFMSCDDLFESIWKTAPQIAPATAVQAES